MTSNSSKPFSAVSFAQLQAFAMQLLFFYQLPLKETNQTNSCILVAPEKGQPVEVGLKILKQEAYGSRKSIHISTNLNSTSYKYMYPNHIETDLYKRKYKTSKRSLVYNHQ